MTIAPRLSVLVLILLAGTILRFWNLELKPLWLDEVITGLFSFGRSYFDVPLQQALPAAAFQQIFTLNPEATCTGITLTVSTQSVHPPLFFCWMNQWLNWLNPLPMSWVWKLRAFPAAIGVVAIVASYQLNRLAFSVQAGLLAAAVMAVSPFAVYLSQEARHYTLPMLLVILALSSLYQLLLDLQTHKFRPINWLGWIAINSLGFYVHYFFLLAVAAQSGILLWQSILPPKNERSSSPVRAILVSSLAIAIVCLTYLPWLSTLFSHINRPETDWVKVNASGVLAAIAPLLQIVSGWTLTTIALPVENQPLPLAILNGTVMVLFSGWLAWQVGLGLWRSWHHPQTHLGTRMLLAFWLTVTLEFLAIAYLLGKDFTQVPRYNFIYFPAICALIGLGCSQPKRGDRYASPILFLVASFSSVLVISNYVFLKPYNPDQVATTMLQAPQTSLLVTSAYSDFQDVALGLSYALQLADQAEHIPPPTPHFAFIGAIKGYEAVWQKLSQLSLPLPDPINVWIIAPGLKRADYPQDLTLGATARSHQCAIVPDQHYRIGIPYQLYRCPE